MKNEHGQTGAPQKGPRFCIPCQVHIFRHLSSEQITKLVQSFVLQRYRKGGVGSRALISHSLGIVSLELRCLAMRWVTLTAGAHVIKQGEVGSSFFVIASGDVNVEINGKFIRCLAGIGNVGRGLHSNSGSKLCSDYVVICIF